MALDPKIWGPQYWFVIHTIALTYPLTPSEVTKKKYYDFFHNIPLFIPIQEIGNTFSGFLDRYPVTPYLDSRPSLVKWTHFIHNKINVSLGLEEIPMDEAMSAYYSLYKPKIVVDIAERKRREKLIFLAISSTLTVLLVYLRMK